jgi:predicted deoxyguanosinetriphosphate triphosphohydrolase
MDYFYIVKVKHDQEHIIGYIESSYNTQIECSYYLSQEDESNIDSSYNFESMKSLPIVFLIFNNTSEIKALYIGEVYLGKNKKPDYFNQTFFQYKIDYKTESLLPIQNFYMNLAINLRGDFKPGSYVFKETGLFHYESLKEMLKPLYNKYKKHTENFRVIEQEKDSLCSLAQKNHQCQREFYVDEKEGRNEYQRDRERIVHSKASRRLVDKAQIFTSTKGDHYRTRMTHTIEVSQIARGISSYLQLNPDLTEAIALAHDIGHTPFGHQGERTLNQILKGNIHVVPDVDFSKLNLSGFKHNFQALKILTYIEEKYAEYEGLNLSYQVLEGVLKHTNIEKGGALLHNIDEFAYNIDKAKLYLDHPDSTTLEGQTVAAADEIAQISHDLDDAFAAQKLDYDVLRTSLSLTKTSDVLKILIDIKEEISNYKKNNRIFVDENEMFRAIMVSRIVNYFISDVACESKKNIDSFIPNTFFDEKNRIDKKLVCLSPQGDFTMKVIKSIVGRTVINCSEVSQFDSNADAMVRYLFKVYYLNPRIMRDSILVHIKKDFLQNDKTRNTIDYRIGNPDLIHDEIQSIIYNQKDDEYIEKRRIVVRNIADYIGGMTDSFAMNEYHVNLNCII